MCVWRTANNTKKKHVSWSGHFLDIVFFFFNTYYVFFLFFKDVLKWDWSRISWPMTCLLQFQAPAKHPSSSWKNGHSGQNDHRTRGHVLATSVRTKRMPWRSFGFINVYYVLICFHGVGLFQVSFFTFFPRFTSDVLSKFQAVQQWEVFDREDLSSTEYVGILGVGTNCSAGAGNSLKTRDQPESFRRNLSDKSLFWPTKHSKKHGGSISTAIYGLIWPLNPFDFDRSWSWPAIGPAVCYILLLWPGPCAPAAYLNVIFDTGGHFEMQKVVCWRESYDSLLVFYMLKYIFDSFLSCLSCYPFFGLWSTWQKFVPQAVPMSGWLRTSAILAPAPRKVVIASIAVRPVPFTKTRSLDRNLSFQGVVWVPICQEVTWKKHGLVWCTFLGENFERYFCWWTKGNGALETIRNRCWKCWASEPKASNRHAATSICHKTAFSKPCTWNLGNLGSGGLKASWRSMPRVPSVVSWAPTTCGSVHSFLPKLSSLGSSRRTMIFESFWKHVWCWKRQNSMIHPNKKHEYYLDGLEI